MIINKLNIREGEQIYEIACDCGSVFTTLIFRINGKSECPNCKRQVSKVSLCS